MGKDGIDPIRKTIYKYESREIRRFVKCRVDEGGNWLQKIFGVARGSNPQSFAFTVSCNSTVVLVKKGAQLRSHKV